MQKIPTKPINSNEWVINQKKPKNALNPIFFEKSEKEGKTTTSRVSLYLCCYGQVLWILNFRYKKYAENFNQINQFLQMGDQ